MLPGQWGIDLGFQVLWACPSAQRDDFCSPYIALKELIEAARHWLTYVSMPTTKISPNSPFLPHSVFQKQTNKHRTVTENRQMQVDNFAQTWPLGRWWHGRLFTIENLLFLFPGLRKPFCFCNKHHLRAYYVPSIDEENLTSQHTVSPPIPRILKQQIQKHPVSKIIEIWLRG